MRNSFTDWKNSADISSEIIEKNTPAKVMRLNIFMARAVSR